MIFFLDPFAGTGAIGNCRAEKDFQAIINIEKDKEVFLKQKSINKNFNNKIISKQGDFLTIDIPKSGKINKIVTDPPWGFFEKIENIDLFYIKMLRKMLEISTKNVETIDI
jgi:tRNA G10  N-methylase Trm11